jgi:hypothetical protein
LVKEHMCPLLTTAELKGTEARRSCLWVGGHAGTSIRLWAPCPGYMSCFEKKMNFESRHYSPDWAQPQPLLCDHGQGACFTNPWHIKGQSLNLGPPGKNNKSDIGPWNAVSVQVLLRLSMLANTLQGYPE